MTDNQSDYLQRLGCETLRVTGANHAKLLLEVEVDDGVISANLFLQTDPLEPVRFYFAPASVRDLAYEFWETGGVGLGARSWSAMYYLIENGRFAVDFDYSTQFSNDDPIEQRQCVIRKYFSGATIDYSNPDPLATNE